MFEYLRESWSISRLHRQIARERKIAESEINAAERQGREDDAVRVEVSAGQHIGRLYHQVDELLSDRLLRQAADYGVQSPNWGSEPFFEKDSGTLTEDGTHHVKSLIREEKKYRREARFTYINSAISFLSLVVAFSAAYVAVYSQNDVANRQMRHEDDARLETEKRQRVAVAIVMATQIGDARGVLTGLSRFRGAPYVSVVKGWKVPIEPLTKWSSEELALFPEDFLKHYGALILAASSLSATVDTMGISQTPSAGETVPEDEMKEIQGYISSGVVSSGYLAQELAKIYQGGASSTTKSLYK